MLNKWKNSRINALFRSNFLTVVKELTGILLAVILCISIEYYRIAYIENQVLSGAKQQLDIFNFFKPQQFPLWKVWSIILVGVMYMFYKRVHLKLFVVFGLFLNLIAMFSLRPTGLDVNLEYIVTTFIYDFIEIVVIYFIFQLLVQSSKKADL
ncbi:MAG: hypothetical protein ACK4Y6_08925 [Bacteroidota bacterium]|jgi:hypothetical protein